MIGEKVIRPIRHVRNKRRNKRGKRKKEISGHNTMKKQNKTRKKNEIKE